MNNIFPRLIFILQSFTKKIFLIFNLVHILDKIFYLFLKKDFYIGLKNFLKAAPTKKKILDKNIIFFIPNEIIDWRIKTFFTKEPETLEWIDTFEGENIVFGTLVLT